MSFKIHLLIITFIIAAVYGVRLLMPTHAPAPTIVQTAPEGSEFNISIMRASWGLNCRMTNAGDANDNYKSDVANNANKLRENNVLTPVSDICNGKSACEVTIDAATLGPDPLPTCMNKQLQVDYRCFAFDRLWTAKGSAGVLNIKCEKQE